MAARDRVIAARLLAWYGSGHRDLPWRRTCDPYRIWVSEVMLQQTRAQTAIPYYERFLARFPTVERLAGAAESELLALWSGLGYYQRARNLKRAAQAMVAAGGFPREYHAIRALPGVGDYTAAAIASIAFGLPHAVVDGNVLRVVARVENDAADIASAHTRARFRAVAQGWLDGARPGAFNQALMELGATVCLPRNPLCPRCPLTAVCKARQAGAEGQLPVKLRAREPVRIEATLLLVRRGGKVLLHRRPGGAGRMAGFWELPAPEDLPLAQVGKCRGQFRHSITHYRYAFRVLLASARSPGCGFAWFPTERLGEIPLSTTARKALHLRPAGAAPAPARIAPETRARRV
jgi:A/G-specific adenine glycosylase